MNARNLLLGSLMLMTGCVNSLELSPTRLESVRAGM